MDTATGDLVLFLNNDASAEEGALRRLVRAMNDESVVASGGMLKHPDGRVQPSCCNALTLWAVLCEQTFLEKLFPRSRVLSPYWETARILAGTERESHDVEQVMGACLMVRPVERFDERFFLYCEDTELCRRLRSHGRIVYVPGAEFVHELGASSAERWEAVARYNRGKELYFRIYHGRGASLVALLLDRLGATLRMLAWGVPCLLTAFLHAGLRGKSAMFFRVLTAPAAGPPSPADSRE